MTPLVKGGLDFVTVGSKMGGLSLNANPSKILISFDEVCLRWSNPPFRTTLTLTCAIEPPFVKGCNLACAHLVGLSPLRFATVVPSASPSDNRPK